MAALGDALCEQGQLDAGEEHLNAALDDAARAVRCRRRSKSHRRCWRTGALAQQRGQLGRRPSATSNESLGIYRQHGQERTTECHLGDERSGGPAIPIAATTTAPHAVSHGAGHRSAGARPRSSAGRHASCRTSRSRCRRRASSSEAAPLYEESMQILQRVLGEQHPQTLDALANYGTLPASTRRSGARRGRCCSDVLERDIGRRAGRGMRSSVTIWSIWAWCGWTCNDTREAEQEFRAALDIYARGTAGRSSVCRVGAVRPGPRAAASRVALGEAEQTLRKAIADRGEVRCPPTARNWPQRTARSGACCCAATTRTEAAPLLRESYPILVQDAGRERSDHAAREALAQLDAARDQAEA